MSSNPSSREEGCVGDEPASPKMEGIWIPALSPSVNNTPMKGIPLTSVEVVRIPMSPSTAQSWLQMGNHGNVGSRMVYSRDEEKVVEDAETGGTAQSCRLSRQPKVVKELGYSSVRYSRQIAHGHGDNQTSLGEPHRDLTTDIRTYQSCESKHESARGRRMTRREIPRQRMNNKNVVPAKSTSSKDGPEGALEQRYTSQTPLPSNQSNTRSIWTRSGESAETDCTADRRQQTSSSTTTEFKPVVAVHGSSSCARHRQSNSGQRKSASRPPVESRHRQIVRSDPRRRRPSKMDPSATSAKDEKSLWKTAVDPNSGRTYYYHTVTRQSQWLKPMALATEEERREAERKEKMQKDFFAVMEANILKNFSQGTYCNDPGTSKNESSQKILVGRADNESPELAEEESPTTVMQNEHIQQAESKDGGDNPLSTMPGSLVVNGGMLPDALPRPNLIRTISTMDEAVLRELVQRLPSHRNLMSEECGKGDDIDMAVLPIGEQPSVDAVLAAATERISFRSSSSRAPRDSMASQGLLSIKEVEGDSSNRDDTEQSNDELDSSDVNTDAVVFGEEVSASLTTRTTLSGSGAMVTTSTTSNNSIASKRDSTASMTSQILNGMGLEREERPRRSVYGWMDESAFNFQMDNEETKALQQLAGIADEMVNVGEEGDDDDDDSSGLDLLRDDENDQGPRIIGQSFNLTDSRGRVASGISDISEELEGEPTDSKPSLRVSQTCPPLPRPVPLADPLQGMSAVSLPASDKKFDSMTPRPTMLRQRRNTCGTLYVGSTMAAPDKDGTIKCVCAVFRAHILQSEMEDKSQTGKYEPFADDYYIFNDREEQRRSRAHSGGSSAGQPPVPSLEEVTTFYTDIFRRAKMESDCIIISLVYVERLIKSTNGALRPSSRNWRSILFSCMVLSSKVWDDLSMWNADFSQTCPAGVRFSLKRVNELEIAVLSALKYKVKVHASEYAKYYFLMRSMLIKSGLGGDHPQSMTPLDVEGAKRLQQISSLYQSTAMPSAGLGAMRSKSIGALEVSKALSATSPGELKSAKICLERVVKMS